MPHDPADSPSPPLPALDRYRLIREIGAGGMATVYLAEDLKHNRRVALKVMKPELAALIGRDRFLREIEIAARLNHPHVLPLFDSGAEWGALFYVMPFIEGESLRARLTRQRELPVDEALRLAREVASALSHAHHHGLVHRDIKPENILLADGIALVADFGIAHATGAADVDRTQALTMPGGIVGTPMYMSPEQACGERVGPASDIYSLACVLFEMLSGQPPFAAAAPESLIRMHLTASPPKLDALRASVPAGIARVLERALAKKPEERHGSAVEFAEALAAAAAGGRTPTPPPSPATGPANNLPAQRTHFIGRQRELAECARLLGEARLLTLTGIGGCGKTRLALKLAEHMLPGFPHGAWFVDLAPIADGTRVWDAIAAALGVREGAGTDLAAAVGDHLRGRRALIILDNCEHLIEDACQAADAMLGAGRDVRLLATSREGLGLDDERLFALRSLPVPPAQSAPDTAAIGESDAVRLFVDRARRVVPDFAVTASNAAGVADICRRLDGIPLAIELAAARVKVLSLEQIRERLDDRFRLLTGGSRTAVARHQTLQATMEWSYDQLTPDEQRLFRQLAVFSGGWTFAALAGIAGRDEDEFALLDTLSRLVDKSLVMVDRRDDREARYATLETVRQFARDRLREAGEIEAARRRHAEHFLAMAERGYAGRITGENAWSRALEADHDNLRAAADVLRDAEPERFLELTGALAWFWQARSHLEEGRARLAAALAETATDPPRAARARALAGLAGLLAWRGDTAGAAAAWRDALELWRATDDEREIAMALEGAGWAYFIAGEDERAYATFEEYLEIQRATGDEHLVHRGTVALGQLAAALHRVDVARRCASEILDYCRVHPNPRSEHHAYHYLADCALIERNFAESLTLYRRSLQLALTLGDHVEIGFEVQGTAMSLAGLGEPEAALRLAAGVEADWARVGAGIHVRFWRELIDEHLGGARKRLGPRAGDVRAEGLRLSFDETIRLATTFEPAANH